MKIKQRILLIAIILIAILFRYIGINWDQGYHLHPDERFLTMVGIDIRIPATFAEYLHPDLSPLNPTNIRDVSGNRIYPFYVYGTLPLLLNKVVVEFTDNDTYNGFTIWGRMLSAFFDVMTVLIVYKTVLLFEKRYRLDASMKLWAALMYAIAVLPIQLSHFFAVDTFLNFFMITSFYSILRYSLLKKWYYLVGSAITFGLAISSKISSVYILPLLIAILLTRFFAKSLPHEKQPDNLRRLFKYSLKLLPRISLSFLLFGLMCYMTVRIADPYLFESPSLWNPVPSKLFMANIKTLQQWVAKGVWYPPAVQWQKKPISFLLQNFSFYAVGLPYFFFILAGYIYVLKKVRNLQLLSVLAWVTIVFLYQSLQTVRSLRYIIYLMPFFALIAAAGISYLVNRTHPAVKVFVLLVLFAWPLAFISVYLKPHSRVSATIWIHENLPHNSLILSEHWDDALPLPLPRSAKTFQSEQLPVFDNDTPEKWKTMNEELSRANYYILSSNRAWGSIPTAPDKYPLTTHFYNELFAGKRGYKIIKEFTSYPSLRYLGIPVDFPDDNAEEVFTVYDHPKVIIMQKL